MNRITAMTDCTSCGTGLNTSAPLPGDPDNSGTLTVSSAYGGVDVSWSLPLVNDHAVAYTIVYRGSTDNPAFMVERGRSGGTFYFDKSDSSAPTVWYYWVQHVSVNGTRLDLIGPASASALPKIEEMLQLLTGQIDASKLATSLKASIEQIETTRLALISESNSRVNAQGIIEGSLSDLSTDVSDVHTLIQSESEELRTAYSSMAATMDTMYVNYQETQALVLQEQLTRADGDEALAQQLTTLQAVTGGHTATLNSLATTSVNDLEALASYTQSLSATGFTTFTSVTDPTEDPGNEINDGDVWIDVSVDALGNVKHLMYRWEATEWVPTSALYGAMAGIRQEATVRNSAIESVTEALNTYSSSTNQTLATVAQNIETIATTTGELGALYTVNVTTSVDGDGEPQHLVGGFGIYNDGTLVDAGFDVDRFWVGRTNENGIKPFIIDNGTVYINEAVVKQITIDKLRTASGNVVVENGKIKADYIDVGSITANYLEVINSVVSSTIKSANYSASAGWLINSNGSATFNNVKVRGDVEASSLKAGSANIVNTLNIAGNAVRVLEYGAINTTLNGASNSNTLTALVSKTLNLSGAASPGVTVSLQIYINATYSEEFKEPRLGPTLEVLRGGSVIATCATYRVFLERDTTDSGDPSEVVYQGVRTFFDSPSATSHTYTVRMRTLPSTPGNRMKIYGIEGSVTFDGAKA
jgi:hypothetical protein